MGKPPATIPDTTYSGRIALRLRELRANAELPMEDLQAKLARLGRDVSLPSLYAYERGKDGGGVDLPHALIPLIAKVYGFAHAGEWLPKK